VIEGSAKEAGVIVEEREGAVGRMEKAPERVNELLR